MAPLSSRAWLAALVWVAALAGVALGAARYRPGGAAEQVLDEDKPSGALYDYEGEAASPDTNTGAEDYRGLMQFLKMHRRSSAGSNDLRRRFTSFNMPYFKYEQGKRNNGVWIWMPSQGYVSVPKGHQAAAGAEGGSKSGKFAMRYGK